MKLLILVSMLLAQVIYAGPLNPTWDIQFNLIGKEVVQDSTLDQNKVKITVSFDENSWKLATNVVQVYINNNAYQMNLIDNLKYDLVTDKGRVQIKLQALESNFSIDTVLNEKEHLNLNLQFIIKTDYDPNDITEKPVIYLYPTEKTSINIQANFKVENLFTYPIYNNGWDVTADSTGTVICNNKAYNYLFWEAKQDINKLQLNYDEGFIVKSDTLIQFFENTLYYLGLNDKEVQDLITYWVPRMQNNKYIYIHFFLNDECNIFSTMSIQPTPDHLNRLFFIWSGSQNSITDNIKPQELTKFNREGFDILEWGGIERKNILFGRK